MCYAPKGKHQLGIFFESVNGARVLSVNNTKNYAD